MWVYCLYRPASPVSSRPANKTAFGKHTRRVREQDRNQEVVIVGVELLRLGQRTEDANRLTSRPQRVQDKKRVIPQPLQEPGGAAHNVRNVVAVPVYLRERPSDEHSAVRQRLLRRLKEVCDPPHEQDAGRDLHNRGEERAAQEPEGNVGNLQQREGLRELGVLADAAVDILVPNKREEEDGAAEDTEPEDAGEGVVGDKAVFF
jgi:hypothetical protein